MISVVGNVLKDVYLSLDPRRENFEADSKGIKWLDLAFDASEHSFFHRVSTYGGAAVSLEVFRNMGVPAVMNASNFAYTPGGPVLGALADGYRYILTVDESSSYLVPSEAKFTKFRAPSPLPRYLFIDRSANLSKGDALVISRFLRQNPSVPLALYVKSSADELAAKLLPEASLIFTEDPSLTGVNHLNIIYLSETEIRCDSFREPLSIDRIDKRTHLSLYSILAATVLAGIIKGLSTGDSLKLARINAEKSSLSSTLSLEELQRLASLESAPSSSELELITATLMSPGKGILAADESGGSIAKKFAAAGIPDDYAHRHEYRDIFFTTPGIENYLSAIILFDETARDRMGDQTAIPDFLTSKRIVPGVKVDAGLAPLGNSTETITEGLDGLPARLAEYYNMGLRFTKWRAAFNISLDPSGELLTPTPLAIRENCRILAEYAYEAQSAGLVPIVEPEVVYDGDYDLARSAEVTGKILDSLTEALVSRGVRLSACIYKINMVLAGKRYKTQSTPEEVGKATATVLNTHLPVGLGGVVFLSGGQTPPQAAANFAEILKNGPYPWPVTFSFARALQDPALEAWRGEAKNIKKARDAFLNQLKIVAKSL